MGQCLDSPGALPAFPHWGLRPHQGRDMAIAGNAAEPASQVAHQGDGRLGWFCPTGGVPPGDCR